jgi:hypothetical protein
MTDNRYLNLLFINTAYNYDLFKQNHKLYDWNKWYVILNKITPYRQNNNLGFYDTGTLFYSEQFFWKNLYNFHMWKYHNDNL